MARPLRIEFPGAVYHVTARGDHQESIYEDNADWKSFLEILSEVVTRCNWVCHTYCLMNNHYHLIVETPEANLSKGMRHLNGVYTQAFNRRHHRCGHLFQGRYKGILVDRDSYLQELARYVVLNPVRAGVVKDPGNWAWSSYLAMTGDAPAPTWLTTGILLSQFSIQGAAAHRRYRQFVAEGVDAAPVWSGLKQQIYLGNTDFVGRMQKQLQVQGDELSIPDIQRRSPAPSIAAIASEYPERNQAIVQAYATGAYSYREIAEYFGVHLATVGRVVRKQMLQCEN